FFFQAEDGIRDATVTGVPTCALPISAGINKDAVGNAKDVLTIRLWFEPRGAPPKINGQPRNYQRQHHVRQRPNRVAPRNYRHLRSEERRVGKEYRDRWKPAH